MGKVIVAQHSKIGNYYCSNDIELDAKTLNELKKKLDNTNANIILCTSSIMLKTTHVVFGLPINLINVNYYTLQKISNIRNGANVTFLPMLAFTKEKMTIGKAYINIYDNGATFDYIHFDDIERIKKANISYNTIKKITKKMEPKNCREIIFEQVLSSIKSDNIVIKIRKHYYFYVTKNFFTIPIIKNRYFNLPLRVKVKIDAKFNRIRKINR